MNLNICSDIFPDIEHLVYAIELRDSYTQGHSSRVAEFAYILASLAKLDLDESNQIYIAGLLHDVGKIGIPDTILLKPGKLEEKEYALIKQHGTLSGKILEKMPRYKQLAPIAKHHHEDYNGNGYPDGLKGEDIPLGARIISIVDVFDALTSKRIYRGILSLEKALSIIEDMQKDLKFDPTLYKLFIDNIHLFIFELKETEPSKEFHELDFLRNNFFFSDPLTKLLNRDALLTILKKSMFNNEIVTFLKLDIKKFRQYNQDFGTKKGDKLLQNVANILQKELNAIIQMKEPQNNNLFLFRLQSDIYSVVYIGYKQSFIGYKLDKIKNIIYNKLGVNLEFDILIDSKQVPKNIENKIGYLL